MHTANVWFGPETYRYYAPQIEKYCSILLERVMPVFDDPESEQQRAAQEAWEAFGAYGHDPDGAAEAAYDFGTEQAIMLVEMRSVFLATGVSGLFHLFEKQLYRQFNRDLRPWLTSPIANWQDVTKVVSWLTEHNAKGATLQEAFEDPDLVELRHVANAVKHGDDGSAMRALQEANAAPVAASRTTEDWTVGSYSVLGVNIAVQPADVERYRDSLLRFWRIDGTFWLPS